MSLVIEFPLSNNILPDERSDSFDNVNGKYLWNAEIPKLLLLDLCRQTGMRILNGRTGNDANVDKCRYICSNCSSVIDYMLASQNLIEFIQSFDVHDPNILIVHCCVSLVIEILCLIIYGQMK